MRPTEECADPVCFLGGIGESIGGAVNFWQDPFGNTFRTLQDAASGLANDVLPALTEATLPDLSAEWFLQAYAISFATAILGAVLLLIPQILRTARGTMAGRDLLESIGLYFPLFLAGAMFGPMLGLLFVQFFHALSNVFISWGIAGSYSQVIAHMQSLIDTTDPATLTGGLFIACVLMLLMVIGLFLVVLMLIVQLVTLYFTGVLIPLGLVWMIDTTKRSFGLRLVAVWLGILAAHPLLFFLLGFAFNMMAGSIVTIGQSPPLQTLVTLCVAVTALFMAAFSPLLLLKFAPLIPTGMGGTSGPSLSSHPIGASSMTDAGGRYEQTSSSDAGSSSPSSTETTATSDGEPSTVQQSGGLSGAAERAAADSEGAEASQSAAVGRAGMAAGAEGGAGAAASAEGLAAAGTAESATGAGAAIGVPTLIAAAAVGAAEKAREIGEAAADQAVAPMDDQGSNIGGERP